MAKGKHDKKNHTYKARQQTMKLNKAALLKALRLSLGNITRACEEVGVERQTFYDYCKNDEVFNKAVEDMGEVMLDFAESKLFTLMNGVQVQGKKGLYNKPPDVAATIFYLKTKGKKRGYIERVEVDDGKPPVSQTFILGDGTEIIF